MDNKQKKLCMIAILIAFISFAYATSITGLVEDNDTAYVNKSGDIMSGNLNIDGYGLITSKSHVHLESSPTPLVRLGVEDINNSYLEVFQDSINFSFINGTSIFYTLNKTGLDMQNKNITDTNTLTINNGITLYSPIVPSNNETYNFNSCTIGTVPSGWVEDTANGFFRCISGGMVELIHAPTNASPNNNYHLASSVTTDNNFSLQFNVSSRVTNSYSYFTANDISGITTKGIFLSIHTNNLYYYDAGWNLLQAITVNQTYTIKVNDTKVSTGKFDIYVDGVQKGNDINFAAASSSISYIHLNGGGGETTDNIFDDIFIFGEPVLSSVPWCTRVAHNGTLYTTSGAC